MGNDSKHNKKVLNELSKYFYPEGNLLKNKCYDFMGAEFDEYNTPTVHHIVRASTLREKNESDKVTLDNAAILGNISHEILHSIEKFDQSLYDEWNDMFSRINSYRRPFYDEFSEEISILQEKSRNALAENEERKSSKRKDS